VNSATPNRSTRPRWVVVAGPPQERHDLADAMAIGRAAGEYHELAGTTLCRFAPRAAKLR
jgi:hypothetical protein